LPLLVLICFGRHMPREPLTFLSSGTFHRLFLGWTQDLPNRWSDGANQSFSFFSCLLIFIWFSGCPSPQARTPSKASPSVFVEYVRTCRFPRVCWFSPTLQVPPPSFKSVYFSFPPSMFLSLRLPQAVTTTDRGLLGLFLSVLNSPRVVDSPPERRFSVNSPPYLIVQIGSLFCYFFSFFPPFPFPDVEMPRSSGIVPPFFPTLAAFCEIFFPKRRWGRLGVAYPFLPPLFLCPQGLFDWFFWLFFSFPPETLSPKFFPRLFPQKNSPFFLNAFAVSSPLGFSRLP